MIKNKYLYDHLQKIDFAVWCHYRGNNEYHERYERYEHSHYDSHPEYDYGTA